MDIATAERAAIMEIDGKLPRWEAEKLARQRPWDKDPDWGLPHPQQDLFKE